jgi:hypothetical protein
MLFTLIIQLLADYQEVLEKMKVLEGFYQKYEFLGMLDENCRRRADGIRGTIEYHLEEAEELEEILASYGLKR